jgi:hypothetical protein
MPPGFGNLHHAVRDTNRKASQNVRPGIVYEVRKHKVRVLMGMSPTGQPYLSPWLDTHMMRGGAREHRRFKKNQNVQVVLANGDPFNNAYVVPYAPNDEFPEPDHTEAAGEDAETFQLDELRYRRDADQYDWWFAENGTVTQTAVPTTTAPSTVAKANGKSQTPPVGKYQAKDTSCGEGTKAFLKLRINRKDKSFTARIGTNVRISCDEKGAKLWYSNHFYVVSSEPPYLRISEPPVISSDPVKNDDN